MEAKYPESKYCCVEVAAGLADRFGVLENRINLAEYPFDGKHLDTFDGQHLDKKTPSLILTMVPIGTVSLGLSGPCLLSTMWLPRWARPS